MKSIEIIVPRGLVAAYHEHPEEYGEAIVELINGMYTDVYTNEDGDLYTITNDQTLICYLKNPTVVL